MCTPLLLIALFLLIGCSEYEINPISSEDLATPAASVSDVPADEPEMNEDVDTGDTAATEELVDDTAANIPDDEECIPSGEEICDGIDNDCDGYIDEGDATDASIWYADMDSDEYGDPENSIVACAPPSGYVADNTDCDDTWDRNYPGADEYCDRVDNDCDGLDEWEQVSLIGNVIGFYDDDLDGYSGWPGSSGASCSMGRTSLPEGMSAIIGDCDDDTAEIYPGNGCS
jgi:hypothetical protein